MVPFCNVTPGPFSLDIWKRIIFETARDVFDQMQHTWQGSREVLLAKLVQVVEQFIRSDLISISPPLFYQDELRRRLIITLKDVRESE